MLRIILPLLLATSTFLSAVEIDHPLTLSELIDVALDNNPSTRQAWWNAKRAGAALGSAKSAYYPQVGFDANVTNGRTFKFVNGPDTNYTIVGADLILSQLLYDYGETCATIEAAKNALLAAHWQSDWTIQKVMVQVLESTYALMHAQEVLHAALLSQQDADKVLYTAKELNKAGLSPVSDVYTTQATLSQMKMDVAHEKAMVDIQRGKLLSTLGLAADTPLQVASFDQLPPPRKEQTDALIEMAYQERADLFAQQARVAEMCARMDGAKAQYGPKVTFSGTGGINHAFHDKTNGLQYQVMLDFSLPLFNGFDTVYQNRQAYAEAQLSLEEMNALELDIALEVLTQSKLLEASQEMLSDAEDNLRCSSKAYESVLDRYKAGKEGIAELSNALRQLAGARVRYSDVKTRWLVSLANLAYATGTLVPPMEIPCK